jgi:hypothetical protein
MSVKDPRLVDDLIFYFVEKKRLSVKNYNYISTTKWDKYFAEAAELCEKYELTPAIYVQRLYDRMENKKQFFSPEHLRGGNVEKILELEKSTPEDSYYIEITNATLDPADVWKYQHELAMRYIKRGESVRSVLMDSSLKLFAWYRILSTPERDPEVIKKYKHIAKKEMTSSLQEFAKQEGLDLDRILS